MNWTVVCLRAEHAIGRADVVGASFGGWMSTSLPVGDLKEVLLLLLGLQSGSLDEVD